MRGGGLLVGLARLFGAALAVLLVAAGAASAERRVALVLGNGAYRHAPALADPVRDARAVADLLAGLDFQVVSGFDQTKAETQATIASFAKAVRGADIALFYYAGHGLQVSGRNYLLPVDAALEDETSLDFEAVSIDFVLRQMSRETGVRLVLLDACRDNPLAAVLTKAGGGDATSGLAEIRMQDGGSGALVAFATSPGQVADDGPGEHSPFSAALLAHLGEANISITEAMNRVTADVFKATDGRQRPWLDVSLTTEVVLRKAAAAAPLIVGEAAQPPADAGAQTPAAPALAAQVGAAAQAEAAAEIPKLPGDAPVFFDIPVNFGDPDIDGKSIAQLIQGKPHYSPIEGLDKTVWDRECSGCHQWTKERLCDQAKNYVSNDVYVMRLKHPLGTRFKVALGRWAANGCQ